MPDEQLILSAMPQAHSIALHFANLPGQRMDRDELIGIAYAALVDAAQRYDGRVPFPAFARQRVRGAILDAMRAWSQLGTWAGREHKAQTVQLTFEDGGYVVEPFYADAVTRDLRALTRALSGLDEISAKRIRRYATSESEKGNQFSDDSNLHVEFGLTRENWQYHRKRILAKLRFTLRRAGVTSSSDCL